MTRYSSLKTQNSSTSLALAASVAAAQPHLTDDELDELLIELPAGANIHASSAHLASCAVCQQRFSEFGATLAAFNEATSRWSEARSNTLTRDLSEALAESRSWSSTWSRPWTARMEWLAPLTAALLVVAAMTAGPGGLRALWPTQDSPSQPDASAAQSTQPASSPAAVRTVNAQVLVPAARAPRATMVETASVAAIPTRPGNAAQVELHRSHDGKELASDNAILLAIDSAIAPQEPAPEDFYRNVGGGPGPLNKIVASQVND